MVIGDIMVDRFVYGHSARLSPDAPVPVVDKGYESLRLGGAGNVAYNVQALGGKPILIGVTGNDSWGDFVDQFSLNPVKDYGRKTLLKMRIMSDGQQIVRLDCGDVDNFPEDIKNQIKTRILAFSNNIDAIIISDYGKGVVTEETITAVNEIRQGKNIPLIIDPKPFNIPKYGCCPTAMIPNIYELQAIANTQNTDLAVKQLFAATKSKNVLVTCGKNGMILYQSPKEKIEIDAQPVKPCFVGGAGDVVAAVIGLGLASGMDIEKCSRIANLAASIAIQYDETCVCHLEELFEKMER
jgi:rfaE bifunctional protein kinase chain/domain